MSKRETQTNETKHADALISPKCELKVANFENAYIEFYRQISFFLISKFLFCLN